MIHPFTFVSMPRIEFGPGKFRGLDRLIQGFGKKVLLVTGRASLERSGKRTELAGKLETQALEYWVCRLDGEPSPDVVDSAVSAYRDRAIEVVVAVGGGSVIDAGKAISAMLTQDAPVKEFLEGVGTREHPGHKVPFIAVPTTSGTGSEATKNAVLSRVGPQGFKKSLRHDRFVPDLAVIDPELMLSCPADVSAACGMDALTQLLEAYVSPKASPLTDALATSGLEYLMDSLIPVCTTEAGHLGKRAGMACAALFSGIALANAGLGIVHGLASVIGGRFPAPHGVVCGTLVGTATRLNLKALRNLGEAGVPGLMKYARIGALINGQAFREEDTDRCADLLVSKIEEWTEALNLPRLGQYGMGPGDVDPIAEAAGNKNNPVVLSKEEIRGLLLARL
jgi:alcohol dehydrogenase class IV